MDRVCANTERKERLIERGKKLGGDSEWKRRTCGGGECKGENNRKKTESAIKKERERERIL